MSRRRQGVLLSSYSLAPSRKTRRVMVTSLYAVPSSFSQSPKVRETSAMPSGGRVSVPEKMTSFISPPRRALADCSPRTQRMAVEDVAFAAAVGADNGGDALVKFEGGAVRKRLEIRRR
jgi:hypothetical protein